MSSARHKTTALINVRIWVCCLDFTGTVAHFPALEINNITIMNIFSSPIGRLAFLGRYFLALVLMGVGGAILGIANQNQNVILMLVSIALEVPGIIYIIGFTMFPRLVSVGMSKWFTLLLFVPFVNLLFVLFLLFCPAGKFVKNDKVV